MSAYIVDKNHIVYLVAAAMSRQISRTYGFSWYYRREGEENGRRVELGQSDYQGAAVAANMLWRENVKSVSHRYPGESSGELPGPNGGSFVVSARDVSTIGATFGAYAPGFDPVQVLKAADCFAYQSCEHEGWEASEAHAFIQSLRASAIHALPGYDKAQWGAPELMTPARLAAKRKEISGSLFQS